MVIKFNSESIWKPILSIVIGFLVFTLKAQEVINVNYEEGRAVSIDIEDSILPEHYHGSSVCIRLKGSATCVAGKYSVEHSSIIFVPNWKFTIGLTYQISYEDRVLGEFTINNPDIKRTRVRAIYPTADHLPENILKMYIQFSSPMSEGKAYEHLILTTTARDTVVRPFLELQPELWNEDRTLLTLWLDPGRVKRDLLPNQILGQPIEKGNDYVLSIDSAWLDANGLPIVESFSKSFSAVDADRTKPDVKGLESDNSQIAK